MVELLVLLIWELDTTQEEERKGGSMFRLVISRNVPEKAYYVGLQKR